MHRSIFLLILLLGVPAPAQERKPEPPSMDWVPLFNGTGLDGWDTWLRDLGLNNDPKKVFTVVQVDGKPAIRISGEITGGIISKKEHENYHWRMEFKWGQKNWRENRPRDGGIFYHCVGPYGVKSGSWMESLEFDVMEGHCGDFFSVHGPLADVEVAKERGKDKALGATREYPVYRKGGDKITVGKNSRVFRDADHEKPHGEWNTIEVLTAGGTSVHVMNGKVNMIVTNARRQDGDKETPLTRGKLMIISEWSEIYYRKVEIRPLAKIPDKYLE